MDIYVLFITLEDIIILILWTKRIIKTRHLFSDFILFIHLFNTCQNYKPFLIFPIFHTFILKYFGFIDHKQHSDILIHRIFYWISFFSKKHKPITFSHSSVSRKENLWNQTGAVKIKFQKAMLIKKSISLLLHIAT